MQSPTPVNYRDEYRDEREDLPIRLRRSYGDYLVTIDEHRDDRDQPTGAFDWSLRRSDSIIYAEGRAPTIAMAYEIIEDVLTVYAIKIRTTPDAERKGEGRPVLAR